MKELFPQYTIASDKNIKDIWKNALFVFDTNVLLNFYRYQSSTREELLNILERFSERIWIPHHVALEFQRNRLKVIANQNKRFSEVRKSVTNAQNSLCGGLDKMQLRDRHSLINPKPLIEGLEKLVGEFFANLEQLQEKQQKISDPDPLKERIEKLFEERVGSAPQDEAEIEKIYKEAERRFKFKIPPGYEDSGKDQDEPDEYISRGIIYKRKYGDYLIWAQLLAHAKATKLKSVIFVTDDRKEDWWWKIDSEGPKTIGPRPELIEEARMTASVQSFKMYAPEGFLKSAKEFLAAQVSEETLNEVRDISVLRSRRHSSVNKNRSLGFRVEESVETWLKSNFKIIHKDQLGFPDFVIERDGKFIGIEVQLITHSNINRARVWDIAKRIELALETSSLNEIVVVLVVCDLDQIEMLPRMIEEKFSPIVGHCLRVLPAAFDDPEHGGDGFILFGTI